MRLHQPGDIKHHDALSMGAAGLFALDATHHFTERPAVGHSLSLPLVASDTAQAHILAEAIRRALPVGVHESRVDTEPIRPLDIE
jgi:putative NIF3 family GTP cyclohydrolase 1 type 2